jgi:urea transport system permease protein
MLRALLLWLALATGLAPVAPAAETLETLVARLPEGDFDARAAVVAAIGASGDPRAAAVLEALGAGDLQQLKADGRVVRVVDGEGFDAVSGEAVGAVGRGAGERIRVNNGLRRAIRAALGVLTLASPDPALRRAAAEAAFKSRDPEQIAALDAAIVAETDPGVLRAFEEARASAVLASDAPARERIAALAPLVRRADADARGFVTAAAGDADPAVADAAAAALAAIDRTRALWGAARNVWFGVSLGSVLMLAAIGLAISFGVMGVINMAHGELVMIGAYVTYATQEAIRGAAPGLFDWSLAIALPLAFLTAGAVGVAIERGVCRFLYGRPLETLLATWGVSLILQQIVRSIFGPTNREVGNPSWMSGSFEIGQLVVTYNRFWIVLFSLAVFAGLLLLLKRTPLGLQMRAVTQNRRMADSMGIRTGWIDAMTFGLGAGVAGVAGVALSQIDNVSPNLGQGYIVDSFMVVVFGGVGNLWGALAGAFTLGVANKVLEPFAGAVLGKIAVLIFIILFIQKRPRGLFALRGRAVEG